MKYSFILYSHAGCCLCDRLEEMITPYLAKQRKTGEVELLKRDIADDIAWFEAYRDRIPVLTLGNHVVLEGRPSEDDVRQAFAELWH
ncbi:MAG: glutaredoxin family protein [Phycisphaeraceae bacterium]|nr:glutaredoxin family protein [Phycisphaeraceae bacterium]